MRQGPGDVLEDGLQRTLKAALQGEETPVSTETGAE